MWTLSSTKTCRINTKLAREFSEMEPAPSDRNLSERRLQVYERLVRSGQWRPCIWAKAVCEETKSIYRANGKHTSVLFSNGLADEFPDCMVVVETYECATLEDVGRLYGTFDAAIASRTVSDINRAFSGTIPELASLPRKIIDSCASGMSLHRAGGNRRTSLNQTPTERAELLLEFPEFVLWVDSLIPDTGGTGKNRHLCRQGVVAAMFGTWQKAKKDATDFWCAVRDETGQRPTCPDRLLARWLLTTSVRPESQAPASRKADVREFYVKCIHCWNAWRRGEDLKLIKYQPAQKTPGIS